MLDWLWQALVSSVTWEIILFLGGAAVLERLKAKKPEIAAKVQYVLIGLACLMVIMFALTGRAVLSHEQPVTTVENIEQNIKAWIDNDNLTIQKVEDPGAFFEYTIRVQNGTPISFARVKNREKYIEFQANITLAPEHQKMLSKMPKAEAAKVEEEIILELSRSRMGYHFEGTTPDLPFQVIAIQKAIPITESLNEATFTDYINQIDDAVQEVKSAAGLAIEDGAKQH